MSPDANSYQYLLLANESDREHLPAFDGTEIRDWHPPTVFSYQPRLKRGDFWGFDMRSSVLVMTPETASRLEYVLAPVGQLLPLPFDDRTFALLNVTECVDCLDREATERWVERKTMRPTPMITRYAFRRDRIPAATLFKIPETATSEILALVSGEEEEEFKTMVESLKLTGLKFTELWGDQEGGVELYPRSATG